MQAMGSSTSNPFQRCNFFGRGAERRH